MGTAVMYGADPTSLAWCTCQRPTREPPAHLTSRDQQRIDSLERQVLALKARIVDLEAR